MLFESNDNLTLKEVQRRTRIILDALDAAEAVRLLRAIADDVSLKGQAQQFVTPLELVAFPLLSREDAVSLLREHLSDFFRFDVPLADRLRVRLVFVGYDLKDEEQVALREAFEKSISRMGSQSIAEWIALLKEKIQEGKESREMVRSLTTSNQDFAALDKQVQVMLQSACLTYIDQLIFPLIDDIDEAYIAQGEHAGGFVSRSVSERSFISGDTTFEKLSLLSALGKYEKLGSQQVTNSKITIKGQNDPVRPTIFNWLRAYRDDLGVGAHDSVVRGQFLFQSVNGKLLSADEREQVGLLLRSLDDNTPITIDAGRQEVVFTKQSTVNRQQGAGNKQPGAVRMAVVPPVVRQPAASSVREQETGNEYQISNTKYQIQNGERPMFANTTTSFANDGGRQSNPSVSQTRQLPLERGAGESSASGESAARTVVAPIPRLSTFEQAKAIQSANRDARVLIAQAPAVSSLELGKMSIVAHEEEVVPPMDAPSLSRPKIALNPQVAVPAPRAISFEPAKIDNFSFGKSAPSPVAAPSPVSQAFVPGPSEKDNVGALSFSTKHVMPAEKESTMRTTVVPPVVRQPVETAVREENAKALPTLPLDPLRQSDSEARRGGGTSAAVSTVREPLLTAPSDSHSSLTNPLPAPVKQAPVAAPVNRFRITPTGHRDEAGAGDAPSPHVVDLRS